MLSPAVRRSLSDRRGAVLVLASLLMVVIFAFTAFTIDVGYIAITKTELQNAADAAALGSCTELANGEIAVRQTARDIGLVNVAAGAPVSIPDPDIELGVFDFSTKEFTISNLNPNAVRVRTRVLDEPFFFAPLLGENNFDAQATAIAMLNPRDIVFVVDLSGSMNDDTEPCWATPVIEAEFGPLGYPGIGATLMQAVYDDFGYGTFPGAYQHVGQPLGVAQDQYAYAELTKSAGPLTADSLSSWYRIKDGDSESTRKKKGYRWIIDNQIAVLMPAALPVPDSTVNYDYWERYLDYVIDDVWVGTPPPPPSGGGGGGGGGGESPPPPSPPLGSLDVDRLPLPDLFDLRAPRVVGQVASVNSAGAAALLLGPAASIGATTPGMPRQKLDDDHDVEDVWIKVPAPKDEAHEVDEFNNPNVFTFPSASTSLPDAWEFKIGYITYVQFMMDWGRDRRPDPDDSTSANPTLGPKTPLSGLSSWCPLHNEVTAGGTFQFPPREQPMHAVRRSLIAAIQVVKERNAGLNGSVADRVGIVTYDASDAYHAPQIVVPLTANYDAAMLACTNLQAVGDIGATTATEIGLRVGRDHLRNTALGGAGRQFANKVLVLLTDGVPNVWESSAATVNGYIAGSSSGEYYASDYVWYNAALVQAARAKGDNVTLYPVGMGMGTDYDFMDRMARLAGTDAGGLSPRGSGNPAEYEQTLTDIFSDIVNNPGSRLVE